MIDRDSASDVAGRAAALADPTRLRLALALALGGELCVCDVAWISGHAENLASHHLRPPVTLVASGAVSFGRTI